MKRVLLLSAAMPLLLFTACGGSEDSATAEPAPEPNVTTIPAPNDDQAADLLAKLGAVDPGLNTEDSIDNARNTCTSILGGVSDSDLIPATKTRFVGDGIETMTTPQARRVIQIIESTAWCK